eukprot:2747723-Pleurochrysis_carterae.AAC.1
MGLFVNAYWGTHIQAKEGDMRDDDSYLDVHRCTAEDRCCSTSPVVMLRCSPYTNVKHSMLKEYIYYAIRRFGCDNVMILSRSLKKGKVQPSPISVIEADLAKRRVPLYVNDCDMGTADSDVTMGKLRIL